jgi:hypothetical protein
MNKNRIMNIFIGSSKESIETLDKISAIVEQCGCNPRPWNAYNVFIAGNATAHRLLDIAKKEVHAAIFIFSADDKVWYRGTKRCQPRDNVLFESGLFAGALGGYDKAIIVTQGKNIKLPTDLGGVIIIDYNSPADAKVRINEWIKKINKNEINLSTVNKGKNSKHRHSILRKKYPFLEGCWIGYTIQDCQGLKNGEKHNIFPSIAELEINDKNEEFVGFAEIFYRGVGELQYAKLSLLGKLKEDKIDLQWFNPDMPEHKGHVLHDIISQEKFMGKFVAIAADTNQTAMGDLVWYKINIPID